MSYAIRPQLSIRVQQTSADLGSTHGHRAEYGWLFLTQGVTSRSVMAVVGEGIYVGAGPSLSDAWVARSDAGARQKSVTRRLGIVLHAGLKVPERGRFFLTVTAQYHHVGSVEVGPYNVEYSLGSDSTTTMPRTRVSFSYRTIRLGGGVAF